ncbi:MAG: ABC transporter ATP-binding protein [Nitrospirae bacterium]|nr:ABC transporter ATP-binding protein [Nitrospirota bacterium]
MIALEGVGRTFTVGGSPVHALVDVALAVRAGDYLSIMGPSGSGKSTLLNVLGLLDRPNAGRYLLDGREVGTLNDTEQAAVRLHQFGFVFQFFHLVPRMTAAQNVGLPLTLAGVPAPQRQERVAQALAACGLADRAGHRPDQLSGGQRQRVAIARATIMNPQVILADEPTGNLDRASGEQVVGILEDLNRRGMTLIVVTHDPAVGERAQRRIHMDDGRISADHAR